MDFRHTGAGTIKKGTIKTGTAVTCSICLEIYNNPKVLPCLHSFCQACLQRLLTTSGSIKCPNCRSLHKLPSNGVEGFLSDTRLAKEIMKNNRGTRDQPTSLCGMCKSRDKAEYYCMNCNKLLCGACHKSHIQMSMIFGDHVIVAPDESIGHATIKQTPSYKCSDHPGEDLKVYCIKCETVICRDCALYNHQNHSFKPAEKAVDEIQNSVQMFQQKVASRLKEFEKNKRIIKSHEQTATTAPHKLKRQINEEFQMAIDHLTSRKQVLLNQVDRQFEVYSKQVWANKDEVDTTICSLEGSMNFVDRILQGSNDIELAVLGSRAMPQLKSVCRNSWSAEPLDSLYPIVFTSTVPTSLVSSETTSSSTSPSATLPADLCTYIDKFGSIDNYGRATEVTRKLSVNIQPMGYSTHEVAGHQAHGSAVRKPNLFHHSVPQAYTSHSTDASRIQVQIKKLYDVKIACSIPMKSYPPFEISAAVTKKANHQYVDTIIESSLTKKNDHWKLSFETSKGGRYEIEIQVKVGTKCVLKESKTLTFYQNW